MNLGTGADAVWWTPYVSAVFTAILAGGTVYLRMRNMLRTEKSKDVIATAQNELIIRQQEQIKFFFERSEKLSAEKSVLLVQLGEVKGSVGVLEERLHNMQQLVNVAQAELQELRMLVRNRRKGDKSHADHAGAESGSLGSDADAGHAYDR